MRRNTASLLQKIDAMIERYNLLAEQRDMQKLPYPTFGNTISSLSDGFLLRDLNLINDAIKEIEAIPVEDNTTKTAKGVTFTKKSIISGQPEFDVWTDGLWYYILNGEDICVYADTDAMTRKLNGGTSLVLDLVNMPYEMIVDKKGKTRKVTKYVMEVEVNGDILKFGLFGYRDGQDDWNGNVVEKLTSLTIQNWTNMNITDMSNMFLGCSMIDDLNIINFNTSIVKDMSFMFSGCSALNELNLNGFNTSVVTNMASMFSGCSALNKLDLSSFNARAVTNMSSMFAGCEALTGLALSRFNALVVENMSSMFAGCKALTGLNLSDFNTSAAKNMAGMFYNCINLTTLTLGTDFDTSAGTGMESMFKGCYALNTLTLYQTSSFIIKELPFGTWTVTDNALDNIGEVSVKQGSTADWNTEEPDPWTNAPLKLSDPLKTARGVKFEQNTISEFPELYAWPKDKDDLWYYILNGNDICVYANTEKIKATMSDGTLLELDYEDMPYEALIDIDGRLWKVNRYSVRTGYAISGLFSRRNVDDDDWNGNVVEKLTSLTIQNWTNRNVTDMSHMFYNCSNLTSLDLRSFNTSAVTDMSYMFYSCDNLTELDLRSFNTSAVTDMRDMFFSCYKLAGLDLRSFNTSAVMNMEWMFYSCSNLTSLDLRSFNTSAVTDMKSMFNSCSNLTELNLSSFNTIAVTDMSYMFNSCSKLAGLDLRSFNTSAVMNMEWMFYNCSKLAGLDLRSFNTSKVTDMNTMFCDCDNLTELNLSSFNTIKVTDMSDMFNSCSNLTELNLSSFNTSAVTDMKSMFRDCNNLTELNLSSFNTIKVTAMSYMFRYCTGLVSVSLNWNASSIIKELPTATWTVTNNTSGNSVTVTVSQGSSDTWSGYITSPWKFTRTI